MNNIPLKLRKQMAADPFYKVCCITGETGTREDPIEWHHNLTFSGKQVQEEFAILPLKRSLHLKANEKALRAMLDWVMMSRATSEQLVHYSKAESLSFKYNQLERIFGQWQPQKFEETINY